MGEGNCSSTMQHREGLALLIASTLTILAATNLPYHFSIPPFVVAEDWLVGGVVHWRPQSRSRAESLHQQSRFTAESVPAAQHTGKSALLTARRLTIPVAPCEHISCHFPRLLLLLGVTVDRIVCLSAAAKSYARRR